MIPVNRQLLLERMRVAERAVWFAFKRSLAAGCFLWQLRRDWHSMMLPQPQ
jgi:hypothetical protein